MQAGMPRLCEAIRQNYVVKDSFVDSNLRITSSKELLGLVGGNGVHEDVVRP